MNDERLHTLVGLILLPVIAIAVGAVLLLGQRPMRPVMNLAADFDRVGMLQPGGKVRMANMVVGRVKHITFVNVVKNGKHVRRVRVYFYVEKRYVHQVWTNSPAYVSSMSLIGERHLEIDAPPHKPARLVHNGDVLKGHNPSHMDRLLMLGYESLIATTELTDAVRPHWKRLRRQLDALEQESKRLRGYRDRMQNLGERTEAVVKQARQTYRTLQASTDDFQAFERLGNKLEAFGKRAKTRSKPLVDDMQRLLDRLDILAKVMRKRLPGAIDTVTARADSLKARFEQIDRFIAVIKRAVDRGDGTVGAFMKEKEMWDDFKKSGRVIRQEIWRTIARPEKTSLKDTVVP